MIKRKGRAVTVDGLIIKEGKILLVKRNHEPYEGFRAIPGGFVEWDETCEERVVREVEEFIWVKSEKALKLKTDPFTRKAIKLYLGKEK